MRITLPGSSRTEIRTGAYPPPNGSSRSLLDRAIQRRLASISAILMFGLSFSGAACARPLPSHNPCTSRIGFEQCLVEKRVLQSKIHLLSQAKLWAQGLGIQLTALRQQLMAAEAGRALRHEQGLTSRLCGSIGAFTDRLQGARQGLIGNQRSTVTFSNGNQLSALSSCPAGGNDYGPGSMSPGALASSLNNLLSKLHRTGPAACGGSGGASAKGAVASSIQGTRQAASDFERKAGETEQQDSEDLTEVQNDLNLSFADASANHHEAKVIKFTSGSATTVMKVSPPNEYDGSWRSLGVVTKPNGPAKPSIQNGDDDTEMPLPPGVGTSTLAHGSGMTVTANGSLGIHMSDGCTLAVGRATHSNGNGPSKTLAGGRVGCKDCNANMGNYTVGHGLPARRLKVCPPAGAPGPNGAPVPGCPSTGQQASATSAQKLMRMGCRGRDCNRGAHGIINGPKVHILPKLHVTLPHINPKAMNSQVR